jgi:ssDNA thymidine ADP-ribosyltransferase, DarT
MSAPTPTRLFHITAIANLPSVLAQGALVCKQMAEAQSVAYQNIAHAGAQGARARKTVPNPPGGLVHDYVPFYFAPRSPMLFAINQGKVVGCALRQADIAHIETSVEAVTGQGLPFVFYDRNATLAYSQPCTDLAQLGTHVAWDLITSAPRLDGFCRYWHSDPESDRYSDRKERRQAEFLVKSRVPLNLVTRIGVFNLDKAAQVRTMLRQAQCALPVQAMPDWYF